MFEIDAAILATSQPLGRLALNHVRLQDDARFPWIVLIPRVRGAVELEHLGVGQRQVLMEEILRAGAAVRALGQASGRPVTKLNVGQLGNIVPQLHVHVVGRRQDDPTWPGPVWGSGVPLPYGAADLALAIETAKGSLGL